MEVETGCEVDRQRQLVRKRVTGLGEEDVALLGRHRDVDTGCPREVTRPHPGRQDDATGGDRALSGLDRGDAAAFHRDPRHRTALDDGGSERGRRRRIALDRGLRCRVAVDRTERGSHNVVDVQLRDDLLRLRRGQETGGHAELLLDRERALERGDLVGRGQEEEIAPLPVGDLTARLLGEALEPPDALERDRHVQLVRELSPNPSGRTAGRPGCECLTLDEHCGSATRAREMVESARAHDAAAHDHDVSGLRHAHQSASTPGRLTREPCPSTAGRAPGAPRHRVAPASRCTSAARRAPHRRASVRGRDRAPARALARPRSSPRRSRRT